MNNPDGELGETMSGFRESKWNEPAFAREYRMNAEFYIPDRSRHLELMQSYCRRFLPCGGRVSRILDLGAGDGVITQTLLETAPRLEATLVDGSADMLEAARARLQGFGEVRFIEKAFQDLEDQAFETSSFDLVVSSMAIHHLACVQKRVLYERVHRWIGGGGHFLVLDAVLGAGEAVEEWYVELWEHWIHALQDEVRRSAVSDIPRRYKTNLDNKPDTLLAQLRALEQLGFMDVDCYYKYGIFAMFGGRKAP